MNNFSSWVLFIC